MGKASSSKKVARAARAGGRVSGRQPRSLLFPGVLALILVLGTVLVVWAREDRRNDDLGGVPQLGEHIHEALGVNVCGEWLPDIPEFESSVGIHTHGDGVLHIHPFSQLGVGANATLGRFFQDGSEAGLNLSITGSKLEYLAETVEEGETKCDGIDDPVLRVAHWLDVGDAASKPAVTTGGFSSLRLAENGGGFTIFYGDRKADIPKPPHADQLAELGAKDGGAVPPDSSSTTTPANSSTSTSTEDSGTSTTEAP
ncbi:MAG: hypothetical protein WD691_08525 [Acidimicrobiales bacterium]